MEALQHADSLFKAGRFYEAMQQYTALAEQPEQTGGHEAVVLLRMGMLSTLRGEDTRAEASVRRALQPGLDDESHSLALLYLGVLLRRQGAFAQAAQVWEQAGHATRMEGPQRVLLCEAELARGNDAAAQAACRSAQETSLPEDWLPLLAYRLALFDAPDDTEQAIALLNMVVTGEGLHLLLTQPPAPPDPFLSPLLPDIRHEAAQLLAILERAAPERYQLLGQFYLDHHLYASAEKQFVQVPPDSEGGVTAAAYAAYTRWRAGDTQAGLNQLTMLVETYPDEPHIRMLLVLAYLSEKNPDAARPHLDVLKERYAQLPEVALSEANWLVVQGNYAEASKAYQRAITLAPEDEQGRYALAAARFHLDTTYALCDQGRAAADIALRLDPTSADAWSALAAIAYHCHDMEGAVTAAQNALDLGAGLEATFYLGAALVAQGEDDQGRAQLIRAADMSPDSRWRERAEERLDALP